MPGYGCYSGNSHRMRGSDGLGRGAQGAPDPRRTEGVTAGGAGGVCGGGGGGCMAQREALLGPA